MATNLATKSVETEQVFEEEVAAELVQETAVDSSQDVSDGAPQEAAVEPSQETAESSQGESAARPEELRLLEAMLFASTEPLDQAALAKRLPDGADVKALLEQLQADYALRGVNLVRVANKWSFRTANDLAWLMTRESTETRRLSRAAIETLAIIAYHQPVTRAEIEEIRGVVTSKGTLDVLLETGWIRPRGRRKTPGRPLTFGTTEAFLSQFTLEQLGDLPGLDELKGAGLLDTRLPTGFSVPVPSDDPALRDDEEALDAGDTLELALSVPVEAESEGEK
jgi:segregation and condensation protein B